MKNIEKRLGLPVTDFKVGDKAVLANSILTVQSANDVNDTFTVVETKLSFGKWLAAINDRTGYGYVMSHGDYCKV